MRTRARRTAHFFGRLTWNNWMWIHFKVALGFVIPLTGWLTIPLVVSSGTVPNVLFTLLCGLLIAGSTLSIVGIILQANYVKPLQLGLGLELGGIIMSGMVPLIFTVLYVKLAVDSGTSLIPAAFTYALLAVLAARGVDIYFDQLENQTPEGLSDP